MASSKLLKIYESVKAGKRVVVLTATTRELRALKMWLFQNGYRYKTNHMGDVYELLISEK